MLYYVRRGPFSFLHSTILGKWLMCAQVSLNLKAKEVCPYSSLSIHINFQ
jgi:hypothetical protein